MQVSSHCSTSLPTTERIKLSNLTVLTNVSDSSLCFPFVFPWWPMILSNFTCSYCPFAYLLCVYSVLFFLFDFWIVENSLNILDITPLSDTRISNIFSPSVICLSVFSVWSFDKQRFSVLKSNLSMFPFVVVLLWVLSKKSLLVSSSWRYSYTMYSARNFIVVVSCV